ncbi:MAG TPA: VOC family protein [Hyphomonadaceae bacterium]|nr:VOC family protein [Hyphomonadaceae bacterium]
MITGLDHVLLVCPSIDDGEAAYSTLLGRDPDWRSNDPGGAATVIFQLANTALEIMAPVGGGPLARRLHSLIEEDGPGLKSLVFGTDDISDARGVFDRRGLKPDEVAAGESVDPATGRVRYWSRIRLDDNATQGVRIFALQRKQPDPVQAKTPDAGAVSELDHVVINTPNPDRAAALYGARLGLRLALDRSNADWDMRLMFFRTGALTVELAHRLSAGIGNQPDKLYGLSWRVTDIEAAHARLARAKVPVSPVRQGRRPGTQVFTVKDGTMNTPTLILSAEPASGKA